MPKVSLIIPIFNTEKYLERCLKSATNQTLKDIEIILVNDGSTDNSLDIINRYLHVDKRIKVINQSNKGQSVSRNNGILLSTSDYICFMDSDDDASLTMLEEMYATAKKENSDIVSTQYKRILSDGASFIVDRAIASNRHDFDISNPSLPASIWGQLYKKKLFIENNIFFPKGLYYEDQLISTQLYFYAEKITHLKKSYYNYYVVKDSTTNSVNIKKIDDIFSIIALIEDFFISKNILNTHHINIVAKLIKLISNYILVYLETNKQLNEASYIFYKIERSLLLEKSNIEKIRQLHFGIYFMFIAQMVTIERYINGQSVSNVLFQKSTLNHLRNELKSMGDINFLNLLVRTLLQRNIKEVIIYGAGKTFYDLKPLLDKKNIIIKGIIDTNISLSNSITLDDFFIQGLDHPIVISSIAFASEIEALVMAQSHSYKRHIQLISAKTILE